MPLSLAHFCAKENQCGIVTLKKGNFFEVSWLNCEAKRACRREHSVASVLGCYVCQLLIRKFLITTMVQVGYVADPKQETGVCYESTW
jgi:hypothetical protein